jgi:putative addiction module component (TIGR02574 family)
MPRSALDEILDLPVPDRLRVVEEIWESIVAAPESLPVPQSQRAELDRRLKLHEENPEDATPWETVRSRLQDRE